MEKYCLICTRQSPAKAATCPYCGEASWGPGNVGVHAIQLNQPNPAAQVEIDAAAQESVGSSEAAAAGEETKSDPPAPASAAEPEPEPQTTPEVAVEGAAADADAPAESAAQRPHEQRSGKNRRNRRR